MIRVVGTRLIIPQGDTGSFFLPLRGNNQEGDLAIFSVKNFLFKTVVLEKVVQINNEDEKVNFNLVHEDTINLTPGKYYWDVKIYRGPIYDEEGFLKGAREIDSYYSAFGQPLFIIKEVAKHNG